MHEIDIIDETFDRDRTSTYELSIQVSLNGFSYAIKDTIRNTFIALFNQHWNYSIDIVNYRNFFSGLIENKPWLKNEFKRVLVAFDLPYFTIIPKELFEPNGSKRVLEQVHGIPDGFQLMYSEHKDISSVIVHAVPHELVNEWKAIHGHTHFTHSLQSFIRIPHIYQSKPFAQVDLNQQELTLILHDNGNLLSVNRFTCKTTTDVVYYVNAMVKSMFGNADHIHVNLTGYGDLMIGLPEEIAKFFNSVSHQADFYKPIFFSYRLLRFRTEYFRLFNLGTTCE